MIGITCSASVRLFFYAFMVMVVNCTSGMERKSQTIDVVAAAAEKCLVVRDFTAEELQDVLNDSVPSSQTAGLV